MKALQSIAISYKALIFSVLLFEYSPLIFKRRIEFIGLVGTLVQPMGWDGKLLNLSLSPIFFCPDSLSLEHSVGLLCLQELAVLSLRLAFPVMVSGQSVQFVVQFVVQSVQMERVESEQSGVQSEHSELVQLELLCAFLEE